MRHFIATTLLFFILFYAPPAKAVQEPYHTQVSLISPVTGVGDSATVPAAVRIPLDDGWKTYWRSPGDAGLPPVFDWTGSENFKSAAVRWPAPYRFTIFDMDNFGYAHEVTLPLDIAVVNPGNPLSLRLKLDILVCSEICVPETHTLLLNLPAGAATPSPEAEIYNSALKKLPASAGSSSFSFTSARLQYDRENRHYLTVTAKAPQVPAEGEDLFIEHPSGIAFGKPLILHDSATQTVTFQSQVYSNDTLAALAEKLRQGMFTMTYTGGANPLEGVVPLDIASATEISTTPTLVEKVGSVVDIRILIFALIGGLILNLMPCVLPVLSLKILSVVSHGGKDKRTAIFRNFMASAAGIITSFWMMASTLAGFKAAGSAIGWGIQFQHPVFLVFLLTVVLLFAASMWGLFDIPLPRFIAKNIPAKHEHEPTLLGHFLTGAFATLLATPCTAPFLGTAVGFALARDAFDIFLIFTFIGLGLALPYIILAVSPGAFKYMPKPGKWMVTFKKVLSIALVATALWLAHVLVTITTTSTLDEGWQTFNEASIAPSVAAGKVVVVDVTADWCLTCKANKRLVLESDEVIDALSGPEIVRMQADWTGRDESIGLYLKKYGRYGIPFNIIYGPGAPDGIILPELLTKKMVLGALTEAAGE